VKRVLGDNSEILRITELLKAMDRMREVVWTEIVEVLEKKSSISNQIIDKL
jgi:hypothetical protein